MKKRQLAKGKAPALKEKHCAIHVCSACSGKFIKTRGEKQKVCLVCIRQLYVDFRK